MIRKNWNAILVVAITLVLHSITDMATVYIAADWLGMGGLLNNQGMGIVQYTIGVGTSIHHVVDFVLAYLVMIPLSKAKLINPKFLWGGKKNRETVSSNQ